MVPASGGQATSHLRHTTHNTGQSFQLAPGQLKLHCEKIVSLDRKSKSSKSSAVVAGTNSGLTRGEMWAVKAVELQCKLSPETVREAVRDTRDPEKRAGYETVSTTDRDTKPVQI